MSLRLAQITDCHLQADALTFYKGVDADAHLDQCLSWLHNNAEVDLLVLTVVLHLLKWKSLDRF